MKPSTVITGLLFAVIVAAVAGHYTGRAIADYMAHPR